MAIGATTQWRIRVGGSDSACGGGFDNGISGFGTDYTEQDAAQLSLTDLATTGVVTTLTSAVGGFTSAMIGNCIRIKSGTNFTPGYYFITAFTTGNTVTLDRACTTAAGVGGAGDLGGAFAGFVNLMTAGNEGLASPSIATPLAAGHIINIRGAGTDDPSGFDYTFLSGTSGYYTAPNGDLTSGRVRVIGYNGRPHIKCSGLLFYAVNFWTVEHLKFTAAGVVNPNEPLFGNTEGANSAIDVIVDVGTNDRHGIQALFLKDVAVRGSGSGGTKAGIVIGVYGGQAIGCSVKGHPGHGFIGPNDPVFSLRNCIASGNGGHGIVVTGTTSDKRGISIVACVAYGNIGDGIRLTAARDIANTLILNNILVNNGGYGLNAAVGTTASNDRLKVVMDYNAFYNNTSGARNAISAGAHDVALTADPFTNAAGADFTLNNTAGGGAACRGAGYPGTLPGL